MKKLFMLLISFTLAVQALADEQTVKKYRNYTPQQVKSLPKKTIDSELPMMYMFAAKRGLAPDADLLFSMQLNMLMYSGIGDYKAAVRAFQSDLSDAQTGVLTVHQIQQLEYRSDMQKLSRVLFPDTFSSFNSEDSALVEGTLTILDDRIAWPINHQKIACYKAEKTCEVTQVTLDVPGAKSWAQLYQVMVDSTEYYNITRWEGDVIDAEYPSKPDSCRTTSLNLNFKTKEFFFFTKNAGGKCELMGQSFEKLAKPRISQVIDGKKIIEKEFQKIKKAAYDVLASDFRKKVDKSISQTSKK